MCVVVCRLAEAYQNVRFRFGEVDFLLTSQPAQRGIQILVVQLGGFFQSLHLFRAFVQRLPNKTGVRSDFFFHNCKNLDQKNKTLKSPQRYGFFLTCQNRCKFCASEAAQCCRFQDLRVSKFQIAKTTNQLQCDSVPLLGAERKDRGTRSNCDGGG